MNNIKWPPGSQGKIKNKSKSLIFFLYRLTGESKYFDRYLLLIFTFGSLYRLCKIHNKSQSNIPLRFYESTHHSKQHGNLYECEFAGSRHFDVYTFAEIFFFFRFSSSVNKNGILPLFFKFLVLDLILLISKRNHSIIMCSRLFMPWVTTKW